MIRKISKKRQKEMSQYARDSAIWKKDKKCKRCGHPNVEVHHMKGKQGYAQDQNRLLGVSLYLDQRYWCPLCRICHIFVENNPKEAKKLGYSLNRLGK